MDRNPRATRRAVSPPSRFPGIALPLALATVVATVALAACSGNSDIPRQQLAGTWVLNEADSQNPDSVIRNDGRRPGVGRGGAGGLIDGGRGGMMGGRGGMDGGIGGRGGDVGGGGGEGGRGGFPGRPDAGNRVAMRNVMRVLTEERQGFVVAQTPDTVTFTFADEVPIPYAMNGRKSKRDLPGLGKVETKAEWKDGQLVVERKLEGNVEIRDEFQRGPGSPRLIVNTKISGLAGRDVVYRTVYDLQSG